MSCPNCTGLREVIREQGELIQRIKKLVSTPYPETSGSPRDRRNQINGYAKD